jgi:hypothetical protein
MPLPRYARRLWIGRLLSLALERAEQRVLEGDRLIAQQNKLIANLLAVGLDVSAFRNTLVRLEQAESLRVQSASKLRRDLLNTAEPVVASERTGHKRGGPKAGDRPRVVVALAQNWFAVGIKTQPWGVVSLGRRHQCAQLR